MEQCLLAWIEQSKINHPLQESVTCPQCRAPYILIDPKPWILRALEGADRLVTQAVPIASASAVGGAVLVASAAYGCVAIRLALGKQASRRVLSSPWPWHFWFDITLIPYALIASRLRLFDTSLAYSSMTYATYVLAFPRLMTQFTNAQARFFPQPQRMYPPSPAQIVSIVMSSHSDDALSSDHLPFCTLFAFAGIGLSCAPRSVHGVQASCHTCCARSVPPQAITDTARRGTRRRSGDNSTPYANHRRRLGPGRVAGRRCPAGNGGTA